MFLHGFSQNKIKKHELKFPKQSKTKFLKSNEMLPDSSTYFLFDTTNNVWVQNSAEYIEYGCDKSIVYAYYTMNENSITTAYRQYYYKNANGYDTLLLIEKNVAGSWVVSQKLTYTYNANNDVTENSYSIYENGAWKVKNKTTTTYNANNQQVTYSEWTYSQYSDALYESLVQTFTYTGNAITQIDVKNVDKDCDERYTDIIWYNQDKFLFSEQTYSKTTSIGANDYAINYKVTTSYNASANILINYYYLTDENGYLESLYSFRDIYTYDAKGNILTLKFEGLDANSSWVTLTNEVYSYTYDNNNNITQKIQESYDDGVLLGATKEEPNRYVSVAPFTLVTTLDQTISGGVSVVLNASGANKYLWSTGATTSSINVTPANTTVYTVTGKISGCQETASIVVTISGVKNISEKTNTIKVYPNPTVDNVNVNISNENNSNITIEVVNGIGASIYKSNSNEAIINNVISLEKFNAGIYFINIIQGTSIYTERIIKK
ncbi:MAG: hypothetical protein A2X12_11260 [Bacteroidetes bacterium GWE2_29_8]|nr:MAG: hypothetical protein A2X12_11260 [Bacteroidetes bacterium GWE2_29_8]OFY17425.1 MAG: hypothetical protein A2X02_00825 [Bacteroidetes bacterium GWF2_29_10]